MNQLKGKEISGYKVVFAALAVIVTLFILLQPIKVMAAPAKVTEIKIAAADHAKRTYAITWKADASVVLYAVELYGGELNQHIRTTKVSAADFNKTKTYAITLPAGTPIFHVRVLAQDKTGAISASDIAKLTTSSKVRKPEALKVLATDFENGKYKLTWSADAEAAKYILEVYNTKASEDLLVVQTYEAGKINLTTGVSVVVPAAYQNSSFAFRVLAIDKAGADSEWSNMKFVAANAKVRAVKNLGNGKVEVKWYAVKDAKKYLIYCKVADGSYKKIGKALPSNRSRIVKGLKHGKNASIVVVPEITYKGVNYVPDINAYTTPFKFRYKLTEKNWLND